MAVDPVGGMRVLFLPQSSQGARPGSDIAGEEMCTGAERLLLAVWLLQICHVLPRVDCTKPLVYYVSHLEHRTSVECSRTSDALSISSKFRAIERDVLPSRKKSTTHHRCCGSSGSKVCANPQALDDLAVSSRAIPPVMQILASSLNFKHGNLFSSSIFQPSVSISSHTKLETSAWR